MKKVGLLFGMENSFPGAVMARINELHRGVEAEIVEIGATHMALPGPYELIIDRISQDIPYYRSALKNAVLAGTRVVNNPFWWSADDKFFNYALASKIGVAVPKTILLPSQSHPPNATSQTMRNMKFPLAWDEIFSYVGFPAYLKPHDGRGWRHVYKIHNEGDFFHFYGQSGDLVMTLQESVEYTAYFRCYCIGREKVHVMDYDPRQPLGHRYPKDSPPLDPALEQRIVNDTLSLNRALGYDINAVEWAIRDNVPYAIDFMNPAPDADFHSIGPDNFAWVVNEVADMAVRLATSEEKPTVEYRWGAFLSSQ